MKDQLLDIDVRLLVLRHGRQKVLAALAQLVEQTPEQLELQLQSLEQMPATPRRKVPKTSLVEVAASECREREEIEEPLRSLALAFENRSFLPNLRDVHRFLDRTDGTSRKFKSRTLAGPVLIRALSRLPTEDLRSLAARDATAGESDYALLSRAIMGGSADGNQSQGTKEH
jgi:hypothetical protein